MVTAVLNVNCNTFVNALQFLNVPEKLVTLIFESNKVDGTEVNAEQAKKHDAKDTTFTEVSNSPVGTVDIVLIVANALANDVTLGEKSNISAGIDVIAVPFIKFEKLIISFNPSYPPTALNDALLGIEVMFIHP